MRVSLHWQESKACAVTGTCVKLGKIKPKKLKEGVVGVQGGSKERSPAGTPHDHRLVLSTTTGGRLHTALLRVAAVLCIYAFMY